MSKQVFTNCTAGGPISVYVKDGRIVRVRPLVIDGNGCKTLHQFMQENTAPNTEAIYTDDWPAYQGIADHDTRHETVNHSQEE